VGAALLSPAALSLITAIFPEGSARNLAAWAAVGASGAAFGVLLGGSLTDAFGWEATFLVNVPVGVAVALAALLGGSIATATHVTKAATRAAANVSPEPFSNWFLSVAEDLIAIAISYVALQHPIVASIAAMALLAAIISTAWMIVRWARRRAARSG
jgi:MFS family permease